jgi:hypothetical protein
MSLKLQPNPNTPVEHRKTDHLAMSGQLCVGRIYKREFASTSQWLWAINGVHQAGSDVMRIAGMTSSFEQAETELKENWAKWLAWAKLQEISE